MNVVVIIADALRLDSVLGDEPAAPLLRQRLGTWYTMSQYFSAAPWTLPACTSLFTGRDASVHGHFSHTHSLGHPTLVARFGTERIKGAFVNNRALAQNSGLFTDFDEYELLDDHAETFARAERFLDDRDADRRAFFLVLHSNIVHDYYLTSTQSYYTEAFPDRDDWFELGSRVIRWEGVDAAQREVVRRMYEACVRALDRALDRILTRLGEDTLILFVSDHGEGLEPELTRVHHGGRLNDDLLRVPCSIQVPESAPDSVRAALGQARSQPATSADLLPTLLSIAGATAPTGIEGRDLSAPGAGNASPRLHAEDARYLYVRRGYRLNLNSRGKNMMGTIRQVNNGLRATVAHHFRIRAEIQYPYKLVITDFEARNRALALLGRRLLRSLHIGKPRVVTRDRRWRGLELFDLAADPGERRNLLLEGEACPTDVATWVAPYLSPADDV